MRPEHVPKEPKIFRPLNFNEIADGEPSTVAVEVETTIETDSCGDTVRSYTETVRSIDKIIVDVGESMKLSEEDLKGFSVGLSFFITYES